MYEWLEEELQAVKTPKFFMVRDRAGQAAEHQGPSPSMPESFRQFVSAFGQARFFRDSTGCYAIGILDAPKPESIEGERYWLVGWYQNQSVLLREMANGLGPEWPAYEQSPSQQLRLVSPSFGSWLAKRWKNVKATFGSRAWERIVRGPEQFSDEELAVVRARRLFRWRLVGMNEDGTLRVEVINGSDRRLQFIGIGVHGRQRGVWLGLALRVGHILPGASAVVEHRGLVSLRLSPGEVELFDPPDPGPEDRALRCEFRSIEESGSTSGS